MEKIVRINNKTFSFTLGKLVFLTFFVLFLLNGCTPTHYGVRDEDWQQMSEPERVAAIKGYNERQLLREQQRLEEKKRKRLEAEQRAREQKRHVDSIYNGSAGQFGDLLRVSMQGGKIRIGGKHRSFRPVSFKIADQECKMISLTHEKKYYSFSGEIGVCYNEGSLFFDTGRHTNHGAAVITYDASWIKGRRYTNVRSDGPGELEGVSVAVQAIAARGRVIEHVTW